MLGYIIMGLGYPSGMEEIPIMIIILLDRIYIYVGGSSIVR